MEESAVINLAHNFLNRVGTWFLSGDSLWEFCCNRDIIHNGKITIGIIDSSIEKIEVRCNSFGLYFERVDNNTVITKLGGIETKIFVYDNVSKNRVSCGWHTIPRSWIVCDDDTAQEIRKKNGHMTGTGLWKVSLSQTQPLEFPLPYRSGHILDSGWPLWFNRIKHKNIDFGINDIFFDEQRKKNGLDLISKMLECGKIARIEDQMFMGFGTALGIIRHGDFVPCDRDLDTCILADKISIEQANAYVKACEESGLGEYRWKPPSRRTDTDMPLWFSFGPKNPVSDSGVKSCQWLFFEHDGYLWHSKGRDWISPTKFSPHKTAYSMTDEAICKGIPSTCIPSLVSIDFKGVSVRIPANIGMCLDNWYGCWCVPAGGASSHTHILVIGNWKDKNTWRTN